MLEFLVALAITWAGLPLVALFLRWRNIVDIPNDRSSHTQPIHRGGGLACAGGVLGGFLASQFSGDHPVVWKLVIVALALAVVGFVDDVGTLPTSPRLVAQVLGGSTAGWFVGRDVRWLLIGIVVIAVTVNAVNFMDGIDGITGLTVGVWGVTAALLAAVHGAHTLLPIGAVAAGAALGFLPANLPSARLFLGDIGSYLFGGLVGIGIMVGWRDGIPVIALAAPLSVYLADTGLTIVRRAVRRESLASAHREHVYQRLVSSAGLPHPAVAAFAATTAAVIAACWASGIVLLAVPVTVVLLLTYLFSVKIVSGLRKFTI